MNILSWLSARLGKQPIIPLSSKDGGEDTDTAYAAIESRVRELAFASAIDLIGGTIAKCEVRTFVNGTETRGAEWYRWNVEPNQNQNHAAFMRELITKLYRNNEALVISVDNQLLIADSFVRESFALKSDTFKQVVIGDFTFYKTFLQPDVLYFNLGDSGALKIANELAASYAKLLEYTARSYQTSRGVRGIVQLASFPQPNTAERQQLDDLMNNRITPWIQRGSGAIAFGQGQEWKEQTQRTYAPETTRDIRALVDDISDFTARSIGIPSALLTGDVQDTGDAVERFVMVCIEPLAGMLTEEINRKRNGASGMSKGTRHIIDTRRIRGVDILGASTAIDKLISSGAYSVNGVLRLLGETPVADDWADRHFITKNYNLVEEALAAAGQAQIDNNAQLKGGE